MHLNRQHVRQLACLCLVMLPEGIALGDEPSAPRAGDLKAIGSVPECSRLTGTYSFQGEALPGKPAYYEVRAQGLPLDAMLGKSIPWSETKRVQFVELIYHGAKIELVFWGEGGVLQQKFISAPESEIACNQNQLVIRRTSEGKGEAVSGIVHTIHTLSLTDDGSLLLNMIITGRSRSFIFSWTDPKEEYSAVFKRIKNRE